MSARAWFFAFACLGGCYAPELGSVPFSCERGVCPDGYRCVEQLCVGDDDRTPATRVTDAASEAPPQPIWDGKRFVLMWQQLDAPPARPGVFVATLEQGFGDAQALIDDSEPIAFDALYHELSGRYVLAFRRNGADASGLVVVSIPTTGGPPSFLAQLMAPPSALGFSVPSLATGPGGAITLAYTLGAPPMLAEHNVFCLELPLDGTATTDCAPPADHTAGLFATDARVVVSGATRLLFWVADQRVHLSPSQAGNPAPRIDLPFAALGRVLLAGDKIALVAREQDTAGPHWRVLVTQLSAMSSVGDFALDSVELEPDIAAAGRGYVTCSRAADGELELRYLDGATLTTIGEPQHVERISRATIASCRLAVSASDVAVAWQELVPPAIRRDFVAKLAIPSAAH